MSKLGTMRGSSGDRNCEGGGHLAKEREVFFVVRKSHKNQYPQSTGDKDHYDGAIRIKRVRLGMRKIGF